MMRDLFMNVPFLLFLTVGSYLLGVFCQRKSGSSLLHPFLICIPIIIFTLKVTDISCSEYLESTRFITFLLGPSVVALGLSLYDKWEEIKRNWIVIASSVLVGSLVGIASVYFLCYVLHLDTVFVRSLESKSVTTPIAMELTSTLNGNVSLSAVSVVLCGFIGAVFGPLMWKLFRFENPVARGLAMGCSAHGLGTARAIEAGAVEGAISGLSIALMGIATSLLVPLFNYFFPI